MSRKIAPVRVGLALFPHLREHDASSDCSSSVREGRERGRENVSVPAVERNTNAEKRDRGMRPMSTTKAIVRHLLNSSSLHPTISSVYAKRGRGSEKEKGTRATRCKTLPVNFIALGTSSYTSTCTTRHLTYLRPARNRRDHHLPSTPPRLLIRSGVNLTAGHSDVRDAHNRTHRSVVVACVHRTHGCTCIYHWRRVGGSAVTNVTVKLLFNYRREDFAYYAIFRSASETKVVAEAGIRPKFSILLAPLTLDRLVRAPALLI